MKVTNNMNNMEIVFNNAKSFFDQGAALDIEFVKAQIDLMEANWFMTSITFI